MLYPDLLLRRSVHSLETIVECCPKGQGLPQEHRDKSDPPDTGVRAHVIWKINWRPIDRCWSAPSKRYHLCSYGRICGNSAHKLPSRNQSDRLHSGEPRLPKLSSYRSIAAIDVRIPLNCSRSVLSSEAKTSHPHRAPSIEENRLHRGTLDELGTASYILERNQRAIQMRWYA